MSTPDTRHPVTTDPASSAMTVAVFAMVSLAGMRGADTGKHLLRVQHYVQTLAKALQHHPRFVTELSDRYITDLFQWAPLHDLGTVGIPDRILLKPGRLTKAEFEMIKTHTTLGYEAIVAAETPMGLVHDGLQMLKDLVYSHHEKWDGCGYPQGLAGEQIPLSARLVAIADVYDALISDRVYRAGMPHDQAVAIIFQGRDSHFDPDMVDTFIEIQDEFQAVAQRFTDTDQDMQKKIEYMANAIAENA